MKPHWSRCDTAAAVKEQQQKDEKPMRNEHDYYMFRFPSKHFSSGIEHRNGERETSDGMEMTNK